MGNWPLASRQKPNIALSPSTLHAWLWTFDNNQERMAVSNTRRSRIVYPTRLPSGNARERGGTAATRPAMHFNASLTNTTRRARSLTKPRNKSLMMEGFYSPHYALLEALTARRHNLDFSSWLVDTMRPIPANQ